MSQNILLILLLSLAFSWLDQITADINEDREYWIKLGQKTLEAAISKKQNSNIAKNIIIFIGDGMSIATLTAARIFRGQLNGKSGEENFLGFEKFPDMGLIKTYSTDKQVPDSAATATSIYSGVKTRSGILGLDSSVSRGVCSFGNDTKLLNIATRALTAGKSVGVVTNTRITHATPAALYAYSPDRDWENDAEIPNNLNSKACKDIARQLIEDSPGKDFKVILGGGRQNFKPSQNTEEKGMRGDQKDLTQIWLNDKKFRSTNYAYVNDSKQLENIDQNTDYLLGLFSSDHMDYSAERDITKQPTLVNMTKKAIEILKKQENGFLLVVEGGRIDHAHHAGKAALALAETLEFEDAIEEALKLTNEMDTLILVTADHAHTVLMTGYADRGNSITGLVNDVLAADDLPYSTLLYGTGPGFNISNNSRQNLTNVNIKNYNYKQQAAVPLNEAAHSGEDIVIYAKGPMSHLFYTLHEQNYIAHALAYAACIDDDRLLCKKDVRSSNSAERIYIWWFNFIFSFYFIVLIIKFI